MLLTLLQFFAAKFLVLALHLEAGSFPKPLSAREEVETFAALRAGDPTARETLIKKSFVLAPQSGFKWRLVVDLEILRDQPLKQVSAEWYDNSVSEQKPARKFDELPKVKPLIVLDPGHGGKDPGAIGVSGVYEKHLTLAMVKQLRALLEKTGRYRVKLTRETDIFIALYDRRRFARSVNADLFVSIHADSIKNPRAIRLHPVRKSVRQRSGKTGGKGKQG